MSRCCQGRLSDVLPWPPAVLLPGRPLPWVLRAMFRPNPPAVSCVPSPSYQKTTRCQKGHCWTDSYKRYPCTPYLDCLFVGRGQRTKKSPSPGPSQIVAPLAAAARATSFIPCLRDADAQIFCDPDNLKWRLTRPLGLESCEDWRDQKLGAERWSLKEPAHAAMVPSDDKDSGNVKL
jgi:hypothetical protein